MRSPILLLLAACGSTSADDPSATYQIPLDLTQALGPGEARAGVIVQTAAAFGGLASEARSGDVKIYNDRVRFIIQGVRVGSYLADQGGGVIDADVVRPTGVPGRDLVDEWMFMTGSGLVFEADTLTILDDGSESGEAAVRLIGHDSPLKYVNGALESDLIKPLGLQITMDYRLPADSPLLEVTTTLTAGETAFVLPLGDSLVASKEVAALWAEGIGRTDGSPDETTLVGMVSSRNEVALAMLPSPGEVFTSNPSIDVFNSLLRVATAFTPSISLAPGESTTTTRYYGVGHDLSELTDAWLALGDTPTEEVGATVEAPDGPVEGARVTVRLDGTPYTMAVTDVDGLFQANVPSGHEVDFVADGRGPGLYTDLPEGAGFYSPYATAPVQAEALRSLEIGATPIPSAEGRGWAEGTGDLELGEPAWLQVKSGDGLPFALRLSGGTDDADPALVLGRPNGYDALGWSRDGEISLPMEPGTYTLLASRGARYELATTEVTLVAGETTEVGVDLALTCAPEGWLVGDPHMHAAPSPDGGITMTDRLVVSAAVGIQLHFGTDHDHVVDYGPLLDPLGLTPYLRTVVATEESPILRGHKNVYPLVSHPTEPNGGAFLWWNERVEDTDEEVALIRAQYPGAIVQINHPLTGMASFAGWSEGSIASLDLWSDDFDAIEVLNGGHGTGDEEPLLYMDLVRHGLFPAAVGVSDSHAHLSGSPGNSFTWMGIGGDGLDAATNEALVDAMRARRTIASTGPFLDLSIDPGSTVVGATELSVSTCSPSWIGVDRLQLYEDGVLVEEVEGTEATFTLAPAADAAYVVMAQGDTSMSPVSGGHPWAMTSAVRVDVDGDGWTSPLPSLSAE